jgi:hypothetical protein
LKEINKDLKQRFGGIEKQVSEYLNSEKRKDEEDKENKESCKVMENKRKAMMMEDLQGMIKDYRKNTIDKRQN